MTLKYESEILFDLMKRDGDDTPSDVLPYESELKEKYLEQVEGAYPKLTDYRPEWLFYNLHCHLPADFPVESLSDVTNATVNNVVPYAYGSASLKGRTLVNSLDITQWGKEEKMTFIADGTAKRMDLAKNLPIKPSTKYLTIIPVYENTINQNFTIGGWGYFNDLPKITAKDGTGIIKIIKTTKDVVSDPLFYVELWKENTSGKITIGKPMFIEYQDGMENWDISYFEGMQSVQMPGLTTTRKNLLNPSLLTETPNVAVDGGNATINILRDKRERAWVTLYDNLNLPVGNYYILFEVIDGTYIGGNLGVWDNNLGLKEFAVKTGKLISIDNRSILRIGLWQPAGNNNCKLRISIYTSSPLSYEPYQSNILTVNEDIELRGIGSVQDELNLLTGELTQRIGEVVLDGSEKWFGTSKNYRVEVPNVKGYKDLKWGQKSAMSDLYPPFEGTETDYYIISEWEGNQIRIHDVNSTLEELKSKLAKNPLHVIFILNDESVKTADLTVTNQDGNSETVIRPLEGTMHLMTEGVAIKPLFSGEIPVEAINQNLMSFVNIEGEE